MPQRNTRNDYDSQEDSDTIVKNELLSQCSEGESSLTTSRKKKKKSKIKHEQSDSKFTEQIEHKIKTELMSDIETSKQKKKKIKHIYQDESLIDIKVEEEKFSTPSTIKHKKKKLDINNSSQDIDEHAAFSESDNSSSFKKMKKKNKSFRESCDSEVEIELINTKTEQEILSDSEPTPQKRTSKEYIKKTKEEDMDIEDYFSAGETQIQYTNEDNTKKCNQKVKNKKAKNKKGGHKNSHSDVDNAKDSTSSKRARFDSLSFTNGHQEHDDTNSDSSSPSNRARVNSQNNLNITAPIVPTQSNRRSISDHIVFEDDDVNHLVHANITPEKVNAKVTTKTVNANSTFSYNMKKYLSTNTDLKQHTGTLSDDAIVSQDDEIWLIKSPSEVTIDTFHNMDLSIDSKIKMKANGQKFEGLMEDHHDRLAVLSQESENFVIRNMALKGCIWFHRRLPKCIQTDAYSSGRVEGSFIPLPETKRRHPLLGADYKRALRLPAAVKERLQAAGKNVKKPILIKETHDSELVVNKKNKRKRKHTETELETPSYGPKPKKAKKNLPPSAVWESEQAIGESLFNY